MIREPCQKSIYIRLSVWLLLLSCNTMIAQDVSQQAVVRSLAWSTDGRYISSAQDNGKLTCWDLNKRQIKWEWQGSTYGIYKVFYDSRRKAFVVLEQYGDVVLVDELTGEVNLQLALDFPELEKQYAAALSVGAFDDESERLAVGGNLSPAVHILDLSKIPDTPKQQTVVIDEWIYWLNPPDIKGSDDTSLVVSVKREKPASRASIADLSVDRMNSDRVVDLSGCKGGTLFLGVTARGWMIGWGLKDIIYRRQVITGAHDSNYLLDVQCSSTNLAATTGTTGKYGTIQLWDANEGVMLDHLDTVANSLIEMGVAFSSDGRLLVSNGDLGYIFWNTESGKLTQLGRMRHLNFVTDIGLRGNVVFLLDSHRVAISEGAAIAVVDVDTGTPSCLSGNCGDLKIIRNETTDSPPAGGPGNP